MQKVMLSKHKEKKPQ